MLIFQGVEVVPRLDTWNSAKGIGFGVAVGQDEEETDEEDAEDEEEEGDGSTEDEVPPENCCNSSFEAAFVDMNVWRKLVVGIPNLWK